MFFGSNSSDLVGMAADNPEYIEYEYGEEVILISIFIHYSEVLIKAIPIKLMQD